MAVLPVYELSVPAPHATFFVNGEKALSVAATINGALARKNYFMSSWFDLEGGEYIMRVIGVQASTWTTSVGANNARTFFNTKRDLGPQVATINLPRGRQRFDIIVSNLQTSAGPAYVAFSLWRQDKLVYTSEASSWVFDTALAPDSALPPLGDERLGYPIFSVLPQWADGLIERISYSTEVLASESDFEQRRSLRAKMRRSFEVPFARHTVLRARLDAFLSGVGRNKVLFPIWPEQVFLDAPLGGSYTFADNSINMREFRAGGLVLLIDKDPAIREILTINDVDFETGVVSFNAPPVGSWGVGHRMIPLKVARVMNSSSFSNLTDRVGTVSIDFQIDDAEPVWFTPSWGYCAPVWRFKLNRGQEVSLAYDRPTAFVTDAGYGPVDVYDDDQKTRINLRGSLSLLSRQYTFSFRRFIDMARGRAVRFWMPTFTADILAVSTIGGTTLDVYSIGLSEFFKTDQDCRSKVMAEYRDGRPPAYADVLKVEQLTPKTERVFLKSGLPGASIATLQRISFVMPVRFDQDSFELLHLVDASRAVTTSVVVRSSDLKGMPPIECALTSEIYPVEMIDAVSITFAASGGFTYKYPSEAVDLTFLSAGGDITTIVFKDYDYTEAFDLVIAATGGDVIPITISATEMLDEAMDLMFVSSGGDRKTTLIGTEIPDEAVNVTFVSTGGEHT